MARVQLPALPVPFRAFGTDRRRIVPELLAGVTLAALAQPLNLGYAEAAGLPASAGLYATIVPLAVYAVLTGSRHLVIGPDATIAAVGAAVIAPTAAASGVPALQLAVGLAALTGALLLAFWALQAGGLVRYLSHAVLVGFIAGLAVEVLTSQVRKILAIQVEGESWPAEVAGIVRHLPELSVASLLVGVVTVVLLRLLARRAPRLPAALITLVVVTVGVAVLRPDGVAVLGDVPAGVPELTVPVFGLDVWLDLLPAAIIIAVLTVAEGLLLAGNSARRHGEDFRPNPELFAMGAANLAGAVTGAMPSGASASRTAAMEATGTRTQIPALTAAAVVLVVAVAAPGLVSQLPAAALAALVANAVVTTIDTRALRRMARLRRSEFMTALVCAAGVLLLGPLPGIVVAVLASVLDVVRRSADAPWQVLDIAGEPGTGRYTRSASTVPATAPASFDGVVVLRPGSDLFFANADRSREAVVGAASDRDVRAVVLDLERVSDVDLTAAEALHEAVEAVTAAGRVIALARVDADVEALLRRYGLLDGDRPPVVYASNREARAALARPGEASPGEQGHSGPHAG